METQWTRMTANEAAEIIQHNDMVAFSGFTPAGSPKALPTAILTPMLFPGVHHIKHRPVYVKRSIRAR